MYSSGLSIYMYMHISYTLPFCSALFHELKGCYFLQSSNKPSFHTYTYIYIYTCICTYVLEDLKNEGVLENEIGVMKDCTNFLNRSER